MAHSSDSMSPINSSDEDEHSHHDELTTLLANSSLTSNEFSSFLRFPSKSLATTDSAILSPDSDFEPLFVGHSTGGYTSTRSIDTDGKFSESLFLDGTTLDADFSTRVEKPSRLYRFLNRFRCGRGTCAQHFYSIYPFTELFLCLILSF